MNLKNVIVCAAIAASVLVSAPAIAADTMLKKVDDFTVVVDQSGSMFMKETHVKATKMDVAKKALALVASKVPAELGYTADVSLMSGSEVVLPAEKFNADNFTSAVSKIRSEGEIFGHFTDLWPAVYSEGMKDRAGTRKTALILVTDGDNNMGKNPVEAVKEIYAAKKNVIVHVISLADTPEGQKVIDEIASLNEKTVVVEACKLISDEKIADNFVGAVFFGVYKPLTVYFDFDKSVVKAETQSAIDAFNESGFLYKSAEIVGWTDTVGTSKYNQQLALKRALALADKISGGDEMVIIGAGETDEFEDRAKNRRAEVILK